MAPQLVYYSQPNKYTAMTETTVQTLHLDFSPEKEIVRFAVSNVILSHINDGNSLTEVTQ